MPVEKQDEHIQTLNNSLAAAFTAKAAAIPHERLEELMMRLETLEELLPEADDMQIDESMVHRPVGPREFGARGRGEGGSMPTPAMLAWARELQVGSWYMLDYRGRNEAGAARLAGHAAPAVAVRLAAGARHAVPAERLAAFLQAGLLVPAQDEALTVRATRTALAKLDVDPSRLLN